MKINIAIVGLGRVGSILLKQMVNNKNKGINIIAVAEISETPGKIFAKEQNIKISSLDEIARSDERIDIIFELTGEFEVRKLLRNILRDTKNDHTVIATETIGTLICLVLTDKSLPDVHNHKGY